MAATRPSPAATADPTALPLAVAAFWTEAAAEGARAWISAWMAGAQGMARAGEAYASLFGQAMDLGRAEVRQIESGEVALLERELGLAENAAEHLAFAAEDILAKTAGPLVPLPE